MEKTRPCPVTGGSHEGSSRRLHATEQTIDRRFAGFRPKSEAHHTDLLFFPVLQSFFLLQKSCLRCKGLIVNFPGMTVRHGRWHGMFRRTSRMFWGQGWPSACHPSFYSKGQGYEYLTLHGRPVSSFSSRMGYGTANARESAVTAGHLARSGLYLSYCCTTAISQNAARPSSCGSRDAAGGHSQHWRRLHVVLGACGKMPSPEHQAGHDRGLLRHARRGIPPLPGSLRQPIGQTSRARVPGRNRGCPQRAKWVRHGYRFESTGPDSK